MNSSIYAYGAIIICAVITIIIRALPFLVFGKKEIHPVSPFSDLIAVRQV